MKGERKTYEQIENLPANAMRVSAYAKELNQSVANVYKLHSKGKIKIVEFQGYNFVTFNS